MATLGFTDGSVVKNPPAHARDLGLIPGQGTRSHMLQLRVGRLQLKDPSRRDGDLRAHVLLRPGTAK